MLIDIVTLSFVIILPLLIVSWRIVRVNRNYLLHRNMQLTLGITLAVVVAIFEYDLAASGGIFELTRGSTYEGTALLNGTIYVHTAFAITAAIVWVGLIVFSMIRFASPPVPGAFSRTHRLWGRIGMITMMLAGATALPLYYLGFVA